MSGRQFGVIVFLQIVIIIMLWVALDDLGYITRVADHADSTAADIFNMLSRQFGYSN